MLYKETIEVNIWMAKLKIYEEKMPRCCVKDKQAADLFLSRSSMHMIVNLSSRNPETIPITYPYRNCKWKADHHKWDRESWTQYNWWFAAALQRKIWSKKTKHNISWEKHMLPRRTTNITILSVNYNGHIWICQNNMQLIVKKNVAIQDPHSNQ